MSDPNTPGNPYGEQPQYGAQPPYGQQSPYSQQPLAYTGPVLPNPDADKRPGSVTAAAVLTIVFSGLTLALLVFSMIGLAVERDSFLEELDNEPGLEGVSPDDLFALMVILLGVFLVWSLVAIILAILVLRRSNAARILLIISAVMTALFSLLAILTAVSAVTLIAGISVVVMLLTSSARDWFARKHGPPQLPMGTTQPWG